MKARHLRLALSIGTALCTGTMVAAPAAAQEAARTYRIEAQPLGTALKRFAADAGIQLLFTEADVGGRTAPALQGRFTPAAALTRLLAGSGLAFEAAGPNTFVVRSAARRASLQLAPVQPNDDGDSSLGGAPAEGEEGEIAGRAELAGAPAGPGSGESASNEDETIVVTGSLIRGTKASIGSQVITIDRAEIERAGFGTTQEVIQSLTQNFQGGISEDTRSATNDIENESGGTSINLRGLGAGSTLTLVNGRRLAPGGLVGTFVDISSIPASLIDRIEVLADGASATYGSDAVAGVVNVILRKDFNGAETGLRFGTVTEGGQQEYRASQLFGKNWGTGNVVIAYEFYKRDSLGYEERDFTESSDFRRLGGGDFRLDFSVPGNILDPVSGQPAFAIPSGQDGTQLTTSQLLPGQVNRFTNNRRDLQYEQKRHNVFVAASQELGEGFELFAEGRYGDQDFRRRLQGFVFTLTVPRSNPFFVDPFGGRPSIRIRYNLVDDLGDLGIEGDVRTLNGVLGAKAELWGDWRLQTYGSYSGGHHRSAASTFDTVALATALADPNRATAFNPFGDGSYQQNPATIAKIVAPVLRDVENKLWSGNIVADGSLFALPGGAVKLAVGASYDDYSLHAVRDLGRIAPLSIRDLDRGVQALFGELLVPLFENANSVPGVSRLVLTGSIRHEKYDDVGSTTNPKVGVLWSPMRGLNLRGTYGTSFRAPDLVELDESANAITHLIVRDPMSPTGMTLALTRVGNNGNLDPETARTWTLGLDWTPPSQPHLRASLSYYNVRFEDRIVQVPGTATVLLQEARFASAIIRNPTPQQILEVCNSGDPFFNSGQGDCATAPARVILDGRLINAGVTLTDGLDFRFGYDLETATAGRFDFDLGGTYILSFKEAFGPTAPLRELVDTVGNPVGLQLRNSVTWSNGKGFSATAFVNYADSYKDNQSNPNRKIKSWTTADLTLAYDTQDRLGRLGLDNTRFALSIQNLFDTDPPFVNNPIGIGYDPENASPRGRFVSLNITKRW